jgi:hypothetical protein
MMMNDNLGWGAGEYGYGIWDMDMDMEYILMCLICIVPIVL